LSGDRVGGRGGCGSTSSQEKSYDQNTVHRKLVLAVLTLLALESVEEVLALGFGFFEAVAVLMVDEDASDEADQEPGEEEDEV